MMKAVYRFAKLALNILLALIWRPSFRATPEVNGGRIGIFQKLPAELRILVLRQLFQRKGSIGIHTVLEAHGQSYIYIAAHDSGFSEHDNCKSRHLLLAFCLACPALYEEIRSAFFDSSTFNITLFNSKGPRPRTHRTRTARGIKQFCFPHIRHLKLNYFQGRTLYGLVGPRMWKGKNLVLDRSRAGEWDVQGRQWMFWYDQSGPRLQHQDPAYSRMGQLEKWVKGEMAKDRQAKRGVNVRFLSKLVGEWDRELKSKRG